MAIDWKAVIGDKAKFPDDAKFTIAGEEVTFGELRKQNAESGGELATQLQTRTAELDARQRTQDAAAATLSKVLENVSTATGLTYEQLVAGQVPEHMRETVRNITRNTTTDNGIPLKDDPLYKPLLDGFIAPMQNDVALLKRTLGVSIGAYQNDHTLLEWLHYKMSGQAPDGFKSTYEEVLQYATNKGYKDEYGFPDVTKAAKELAGPVSQKADNEKVRKSGYDEGYQQAKKEILASMGQPTPGTGGIISEPAAVSGSGSNAPVKSIREKLDEALADTSIAGAIWGTVQ